MIRYWVGVASKEHVQRGVQGGFAQICHGKAGPLNRVTQATIGKMAGLDPNTVSQIIRGLEQKELIVREKSSDGRAKNPTLTMKGFGTLRKALPAVEAKDAVENWTIWT